MSLESMILKYILILHCKFHSNYVHPVACYYNHHIEYNIPVHANYYGMCKIIIIFPNRIWFPHYIVARLLTLSCNTLTCHHMKLV